MILSSDNDKTSQMTTGVAIICAIISGGSYIAKNLQNKQQGEEGQAKIELRASALKIVAKHVLADTCWKNDNTDPDKPFKINDRLTLKGTTYGSAPTGCFYNPGTNQYAQGAYLDGSLQVTQVFSSKEIKYQIGAK